MQTTEFSLDYPLGIRISRLLKEEDVAIFKEVKKRDMKTGYVWYDLPVSDLFEKRVCFSLCFYKGVMYALSVCLWDPELYGAGWDDHSEDKEKRFIR